MYNLSKKTSVKVLLIGVDFDRSTCFHLSEVFSGHLPLIQQGCNTIQDEKITWTVYDDYEYDGDDFVKLRENMEKETDIIKRCKIGNADCMLFDYGKAVDYGTQWMKSRYHKS